MTTIERQRAIRTILVDSQRMIAQTKVNHTFSDSIRNFVDFETINHSPINIGNLKVHIRLAIRWLDWIETKPPSDLSVQHAIRQTRNVGGYETNRN